ncbi:MAG: FadR/GntR family transcriptional regulator [Candidatus Methylomirabilota bacterium]|jgi:GntR family transcriptional repressor for pyruvate dehydrogenase complex
MRSVSHKVFRVVQKTRVSEDIIDQVRDLIASGRLKPTDRLPAEREFAQTLSVSRSAVREAIRAMESLGILEARPGEGTFVRVRAESPERDPISTALYQAWSTQRKLFEVRQVIEPDLAALAARRATAEHIEKLRAILKAQEAGVRNGESGGKQDTMFHYVTAEATGNEMLVQIMDSLMDLLSRTREASLQHDKRRTQSLKQHQAILNAIEARKPLVAERRMREHIHAIERLVFSSEQQPAGESAITAPTHDAEVSS